MVSTYSLDRPPPGQDRLCCGLLVIAAILGLHRSPNFAEVSVGICSLHAMAEGARLTLLYADSIALHDFSILGPITSALTVTFCHLNQYGG